MTVAQGDTRNESFGKQTLGALAGKKFQIQVDARIRPAKTADVTAKHIGMGDGHHKGSDKRHGEEHSVHGADRINR